MYVLHKQMALATHLTNAAKEIQQAEDLMQRFFTALGEEKILFVALQHIVKKS